MSCVVEWSSHFVPVHSASSVGVVSVLISMVWQSRSILGITPCHYFMMEVCPLHRDDDVVPGPLTRTGG